MFKSSATSLSIFGAMPSSRSAARMHCFALTKCIPSLNLTAAATCSACDKMGGDADIQLRDPGGPFVP